MGFIQSNWNGLLTGDGDMMGDSDGLILDVVSRPLLAGRNGVMNGNKHKSRQQA